MTESIKLLESRLADLEAKYQELLVKQEIREDKPQEKKEEEGNERDKEKEKGKGKTDKKDATVLELDENTPLTAELNRISWAQWRKLRLSEDEWQSKNDAQKEKEIKSRKTRPKKYVIDVVADTGDLGFHNYTEKPLSTKRWIPCRIRINSEHILDVLNDVTNVVLPNNCQILHPYKIIVDKVEEIRAYSETLETALEKARSALSLGSNNPKKEVEPVSPVKEKDVEGGSTSASKAKPSKTKQEDDVAIAEERLAHYKCFIELLHTNLAAEIDVSHSLKAGKVEKIMFCHLWHLFPPGETIYFQNANRDEPPQASQVLKVSGGRAKLPNSATYFSIVSFISIHD